MQRWYVIRTGQPEGPFDENVVIDTIRAGQVPPYAQVCQDGGPAWIPIGAYPPFAAAMPAALASAPPSAGAPSAPIDVKKLALVGGVSFALVGLVLALVWVLNKKDVGWVAHKMGDELVRYGLRAEPVNGDWRNESMGRGDNVYETNTASIATTLALLGTETSVAAVDFDLLLCGTQKGVAATVTVVDGEARLRRIEPIEADHCAAAVLDSYNNRQTSATQAEDARVATLGHYGVELWNTLHDAGCDVTPLAATDLTAQGVPALVASGIVGTPLTAEQLRAICSAVATDTTATEVFVGVGGIVATVVGAGHVGTLASRYVKIPMSTASYTLGNIQSTLVQ